jgi:hypothetical protein
MADHSAAPYSGPESIEALTEDRMRMWSGFTSAVTASTIFLVLLLVGMAVFLL